MAQSGILSETCYNLSTERTGWTAHTSSDNVSKRSTSAIGSLSIAIVLTLQIRPADSFRVYYRSASTTIPSSFKLDWTKNTPNFWKIVESSANSFSPEHQPTSPTIFRSTCNASCKTPCKYSISTDASQATLTPSTSSMR